MDHMDHDVDQTSSSSELSQAESLETLDTFDEDTDEDTPLLPQKPMRLDKAIVDQFGTYSRTFLSEKIRQGHVTVNGTIQKSPSLKVLATDAFTLSDVTPPSQEHLIATEMPLDIVFEDPDIIVLNKPSGLVVHPAPGHSSGTLLNGLLHHCGHQNLAQVDNPIRPGIVHRLDKETSGLIVVAKTIDAFHGLKSQFHDRALSRQYIALVWGTPVPAVGIISRPMERHPRDRKRMRVLREGGKEAITHYQVSHRFGSLVSQISCQLKTGRTHQIRAHLANMGHGILGDKLYGLPYQGEAATELKQEMATLLSGTRHCLHACALKFYHPLTGEPLSFTVPLPADFTALTDYLAKRYAETSNH